MWLAIAYAGVALLEQTLKLALNVYRSWVSGDAVRTLRKTLEDVEGSEHCGRDAAGAHAAMAVAEAINRRAEDRIKTLRRISGDIVESGAPDDQRHKLMYAFAVAAALGVGGWFAATGRIDVGTVVAVVSGLGKLEDPWSDLVSWGRELSVDSVKYRLLVDAVSRRGLATA